MNIPDKVKIGIYTYQIKQVEGPLILNNQVSRGIIHYEDLVIEILKSQPEEKKIQTLWHEIEHAIIREWGVDLSDEENAVEWLARGHIQVLKDNPDLLRA